MSVMVIFMTLPPLSRPRDNLHFCKVRKLAGPSSARILPPVFGVSGNAQKRPWKARGGTAWRKWLQSESGSVLEAGKASGRPDLGTMSKEVENRKKPVNRKMRRALDFVTTGREAGRDEPIAKPPPRRRRAAPSSQGELRAAASGCPPWLAWGPPVFPAWLLCLAV